MSKSVCRTIGIAAHVVLAIVFLNASAWAGEKVFMEESTERWGSDYSVFTSESAKQCQMKCADDGACMAWTYFKPTKKETSGECHLKNMASHARSNPCCTSGVLIGQSAPKGDPNRAPVVEAGLDTVVPESDFVAENLEANETVEVEAEALSAEPAVAASAPISITPVSFQAQ
jgi:hypothetical protein